jgi:hypothetical protein
MNPGARAFHFSGGKGVLILRRPSHIAAVGFCAAVARLRLFVGIEGVIDGKLLAGFNGPERDVVDVAFRDLSFQTGIAGMIACCTAGGEKFGRVRAMCFRVMESSVGPTGPLLSCQTASPARALDQSAIRSFYKQAAGITRVKNAKSIGVRSGNWRILWQAQALLNAPDITTAAGLHRAIITRRSVSRGLLARRFHFIPPA